MGMTTTARILLTLACVVLLIAYGGAGDNQRVYFGLSLAGVLLLLAIGMKSQLRLPPLRWLAVLFIPLLALPLIQIIPWGWHHPWLSDDVTLLQVTIAQWSLDPSATFDALFWTLTLSALGLSASLLWRGERVVNLVKGLITIAAATAVFGFLLALMGVEWPSDSSTTRVRGPFIYPNHAAAFWTAILPLAMLMAQRQRQQHLLLRWGSVAIIALAILLSASRGGIIVASVICLPLALTLLPRHGRYRWGLGLSFGIATWLWIIGLGDVISRFDQLRGVDGLTLSGRMTIWQYAWPTIMDAGALGSGAGTTTVAYRRSADTTFTDGIVNHLHSDPLEWWLEYGWIGLIALIGSMVWLIYLAKKNPTTTNEHVALRRGAALGLLALCLHAGGDFVWHSAAVAGVGLLLVVVLMLAGGNGLKQQPQSSRWLRLTCLLLALSLLFCAWPSWQHVRSDLAARDAERHLVARAAANLPLTTGDAIDALRTLPSDSIRLANAQAWLARTEQRPADAEHILQLAAVLAPGDAAAWMERALLAGERGDQKLMRVAIGRALHWAPTWPDVQQAALRLVSGYGQAALPPEEAKGILLSMLQQDRSQAPWFFALCERILGAEFLSQQLLVSQPNLARSSERWVAANSSVHQWLTLRQRLGPPSASSVWMAPITSLLYGTEPVPEIMPAGAEARRQLVEDLLRAGMPIPSSLSQMISADGPLYALWAQPFDLISPPIRESMSLLLRSELHRTWAKPWADRLSMMTRAQTGDTTSIGRDSDPLIIAWLAGLHPVFSPPVTISNDERQRITALLSRWNEWEWTNVDLQVRWSWRYHGSQRSAMITTATWTAVVIDGVWQGWIRGTTDIGPLIGSGLHRIVLISP
jgi:O-antigen ligase